MAAEATLTPELEIDQERKDKSPEIVDMGKAVAFFLQPPAHLSMKDTIGVINDLRSRGFVISSAEEGRRFVGFLPPNSLPFLQEYGYVSLGTCGDTNSLYYFDPASDRSIQGCMSTIAAARGSFDGDKTEMGWKIVREKTANSRNGYKQSIVEPYPLSDIEVPTFPENLNPEVFRQINPEKVETAHFEEIDIVRIDANDISTAFGRVATTEGQVMLNQKLIEMFNQIEEAVLSVSGANIKLGDRTTDSLLYYLPETDPEKKKILKRQIEELVAPIIYDSNIAVKHVATTVKDVELGQVNGRVFYSSKPIEEEIFKELEEEIRAFQHINTISQPHERIEPHVFQSFIYYKGLDPF